MFANRFHVSMALTACTLMSSAVLAEKQIVEVPGVSSVRLYANYTFQDCCDLDSISNGESTIFVGTCETMGGYCVAGKKVAIWNFELPEFPENAVLLSATFQGRHNAGSSPVYYRGNWYPTSSLGYSQAISTFNSGSIVGTASSAGGAFSTPLPIELLGGQWTDNYLVLTGYNGSGMSIYNSGTLAPKIRLVIDIPDELCLGDMNDDDSVDTNDVLHVIGNWGDPYGVNDIMMVLEHWGSNCEAPGACCLQDGTCAATDSADCQAAGGEWNGPNTYCTLVDCPEFGACCWEDETCEALLSDDCKANGGNFRGQDTTCASIDCTIPEYNDECEDAASVTSGTIAFSTLKATTSSDVFNDAQCLNTYLGQMNADVWFSYDSTCNGTLIVSTCDSATFDTDLVVYQGTCNEMEQIACNGDGTCTGYTSYLETPITSGNSYLIRIGGWDANSAGTGTLSIECVSSE